MAAALGITLRVAAEIYGGGRSALNTFPADIQPVPLVSDPTDISMVPNQAVVTEPASTAIHVHAASNRTRRRIRGTTAGTRSPVSG